MTAPFTPPLGGLQGEPKRDRWGRYLLPDPNTGKERAWTRATTFAKTISDMYGLGKWQERMVAKGLGMRHDLYALAVNASIDDKARLERICDDAKEAAKASSGANLGTALHGFTEQLDAGVELTVPPPWDADVDAYRTALNKARIIMHPPWIERIVVVPELGIAGTLDRIIGHTDWLPDLRIADVKTGKTLDYSWGEIAIQLAIYAAATHMWNPDSTQYEPMPGVDQSTALVMHLPVGQARCDLYDVDIAAGLEALQLCADVRGWRSRKDIAVPHVAGFPTRPSDFQFVADRAHMLLTERIEKALNREALESLWTVHKSEWTADHTLAAQQRLAVLQTPAGTTGGPVAQEGAVA